ncbi:MAG: LysR family transcriptional regulator [Devosia sp.]|nr:LysR family transcriptional regulator [Devosia sp.]
MYQSSQTMMVTAMLDIRRLKYFVAVARCGSMAAAARELNIAQPALSNQTAELERLVGFRVFERLPRGVRLTQGGELLLEHARIILDSVASAENAVRAHADSAERSKVIRLGLLPSLALIYGDAVLEAARLRFPDIAVHILEVRNDEAVRLVQRGELDLTTTLEAAYSAMPTPILDEPMLVVSRDPLKPSYLLAELAGLDLILTTLSHPSRIDLEREAERHGFKLRVVMEIDSHLTLKRAVMQGLGQAVIAYTGVRLEVESGQLNAAPISDFPLKRSVYLARAAGFDSRVTAQFFQLLQIITRDAGERH